MYGWVDGWMDGWKVGFKAVLRIAYSNPKVKTVIIQFLYFSFQGPILYWTHVVI